MTMTPTRSQPGGVAHRPAWAEIDLDAFSANTAALAALVAPAQLCAVVKANAYGHGARSLGAPALAAGASMLAVALVEEGVELRDAGISAPILLLSEPPESSFEAVVAAGLTPTIYHLECLRSLAEVAGRVRRRVGVHVKIDTGMHRVGAAAVRVGPIVEALASSRWLSFDALWTHFAVADDAADPYTRAQLESLLSARDALAHAGHAPRFVHAANSAGALYHAPSHLDLVRGGLALYGYLPDPARPAPLLAPLTPVLSLRAQVTHLQRLSAGERVSYGLRYELARDATLATVPLGYHDGVPRRYGLCGGEVLIRGRRRRVAGTVTMDQLLVDCGDGDVALGDEVVVIGRQGEEEISAWEVGERLSLLAYEVLCGIGERVPRRVVSPGATAGPEVGKAAGDLRVAEPIAQAR